MNQNNNSVSSTKSDYANLPATLIDSVGNLLEPEELDLSHMTLADAKTYVMLYVTSSKQLEKDINELKANEKLWLDRINLAKSKGLEELAGEAEIKWQTINFKLSSLESEYADLKLKADLLMTRLKDKKNEFHESINTDSVLMQLEGIIGQSVTDMKTEQDLDKLDVDAKLDELKKKINKSNK